MEGLLDILDLFIRQVFYLNLCAFTFVLLDFPDIDEPRKRTLVLAPEYERNYGRPPGIPEPSQQENMPMLPHSQYQPLPRPSSAPRSEKTLFPT